MSESEQEPSSSDASQEESLLDDAPPMVAPEVPRLAVILGAVGRSLITAGLVVFLFVAYQLWGTGIQERRAQNDLSSQLEDNLAVATQRLEAASQIPVTTTTQPAAPSSTAPESSENVSEVSAAPTTTSTLPGGYDPDLLALFFPENGDALARIEIPAIEVDKIVVRGVNVADLRKGPGHYPSTVLPGNAGNFAIAGHRTTYGAPFNRIDELMPGDEVTVIGVQGKFTYRVLDPNAAYPGYEDQVDKFGPGHIIVKPSATWVLGDFGDNRITLTACHPKLSARQRIIVTAELVGETVHIPTWAEQARSEALVAAAANPGLGADEDETPPTTDQPVASQAVPTTTQRTFDESPPINADLDTGLNGERGAIPGAALWMLGAMFFWIGAGKVGQHRTTRTLGRIGYRLAGLLPALVFMWFSFEMIDRALPAY